MEKSRKRKESRRGSGANKKQALSMGVVMGLLLVAAGIIAVLHNTGVVPPYIYGIVFSWQMLLIILGVFSAISRHYESALLTAGVGLFFLVPKFTGAGTEWMSVYWPLILVFIGILVLVRVFVPAKRRGHHTSSANHRTENGFVHMESSLGAYEHIVLDEQFKGATITSTLSGTVLDLRHTTIGEGETFIDIYGTLSGIEIYAPADWEIVSQIKFVIGGVEDKRRGSVGENLPGRRIVLCGNMTLGGIEIKS